MTTTGVLVLFILFLTKHFVIDFLCQNEYQWSHKHIWMHPGGQIHAGLHMIGTAVILLTTPYLPYDMAIVLGMYDGAIHYLIDFAKMNINIYKKWTPSNPQFWYLTGLDQFLHYLTYCAISWYIISVN
jgi:hypothetical protein